MGPAFRLGDRARRRYAASTTGCIDDRPIHRRRRLASRGHQLTRSPPFPVGSLPEVLLLTDNELGFRSPTSRSETEYRDEERGDYFPMFKGDTRDIIRASTGKMNSLPPTHNVTRNHHSKRGCSAQHSFKDYNYSETTSIQSSEPTMDSNGPNETPKFPDTIAAVMKRALFRKSEIEGRQAIFSKLKQKTHSPTSKNALNIQNVQNAKCIMKDSHSRHRGKIENSETSSEDVNVSYTYSRPHLRHKKPKMLNERSDAASSHCSVESADITFTVQRPSFVFEHPEATYLLTKIPKKKFREATSSTSSSEFSASNQCEKGGSHTLNGPEPSPKDCNGLTLPLEEPFHETKESFDIYSNDHQVNKSWEADIQAIYAAISHITPPSTRRHPKRHSKHWTSPWTPQREPGDRGIICVEKWKPPTIRAPKLDQASGYNLEDRGTSPLPQPSLINRGVGYVHQSRGTSPFHRVATVDKEITVDDSQEDWKGLESKNTEKTMKAIARLTDIHPPVEHICMNTTIETMAHGGSRRSKQIVHNSSPETPPKRKLPDKGLVVFSDRDVPIHIAPTDTNPLEMDSEWSGHSIVIPGFVNNQQPNEVNASPNKFWPAPYPFEVLGRSYTMQKPHLDAGVKEAVKMEFEEGNSTMPEKISFSSQSAETWHPVSGYVAENNIVITEPDAPVAWYPVQPSANQYDKCEIQELSSIQNPPEMTYQDNDKHIYQDTNTSEQKIIVRSSWQLPQEKLAHNDSLENVPIWVPSPLDVTAAKPQDNRSLPKLRTAPPPIRRRLHVAGCPGACGGNKKVGGCVLLRNQKIPPAELSSAKHV